MKPNRLGLTTHLTIGALGIAAGAGITAVLRRGPSLDPVTTHGEWVMISTPTGNSIRAYVAYPERRDRAPAVIVIHEIFGLTDWEPTVGDRLAGKGYVAIVPDLLSSRFGPTPPASDSARKLMALLVPDQVTADLDAVYAYVNALPAVRTDRVGVMGFCWGGGQTFRYATNNPRLRAAVVCYGPNPDTTTLARVQAPVLGVYGENDARINGMLPTVARIMQGLGKSFVADSYPGTGHGFLKPGRRGYDTDQVDKAWTKIESFFKENLEK
jgi:carboxymethylenebutenolidase